MGLRRIAAVKGGLVIACCATVVTVSGCGFLQALMGGDTIGAAASWARMLDPGAIVFQANGVNGASLDGSGSRTVKWEFLAINPDDRGVTHKITYDGLTWATSTHAFPTMGIGYYDLTQVTMTEARARELLKAAGHGDDFFGWSLYRPLHPASCQPLYAFTHADKMVTVNTETEEVTVKTVQEVLMLGAAPGDDSVSRERIAAADAKIKETDPTAFIVWAGGRDGDGNPLNAPGDTNVWDFMAVAFDDTSVTAWHLMYDGDWLVEVMPTPPFEIEYLDLNQALTMDVVEAWGLVVAAGFAPPFNFWEVFKALNPTVENPAYAFPLPTGYVFVDTVTGEVTEEFNTCVTRACFGHE